MSAVTDLAFAAGWRFVRVLPQSAAARLFDVGADHAVSRGAHGHSGAGAVAQLRKNLGRVLGVAPEQVPDALIRDSMRSYARYWREAFQLPAMDLPRVGRELAASATGAEYVDAALAAGTGALIALPHSGNWDMAGVFAVSRWGEFTTVAERLKPEALFWRFVRYRESLGFEILPQSGGSVVPTRVLAQRLRDNRVVCLMGERDLSGRGVEVSFFGERTSMPAGPAKLAIDTGAPLFPAHCWFDGAGWRIQVDPPVDVSGGVEAVTQLLADAFAANIAAHPADWHMLQPLWFDDLSADRRARLREARDTRS